MSSVSEICAVIVTYNPSFSIAKNITSLLNENIYVIIVDNNSNETSKHYMFNIKSKYLKVITNSKNLGIAAALNIGIKEAESMGKKWVMTFDQDSEPDTGYAKELLDAYCSIDQQIYPTAVIAPLYRHGFSGDLMAGQRIDQAKSLVSVKTIPTSGNLVPIQIFQCVGYFREDYFIDYVDFEFCIRCRKFGYYIMQTSKTTLFHNLGNTGIISLFGKKIHVTHHNRFRRYYITRNRIHTYLIHGTFDLNWLFSDLKTAIFEFFKVILFENDKLCKLKYTVKGIIDAFSHKLGEI